MRSQGRAIILSAAFCGVVLANTLHNDLLWDDCHTTIENLGIREFAPPLTFFTPSCWEQTLANYCGLPGRGYRLVPQLLFAVKYSLWRVNPVGCHATSLLVHAAHCSVPHVLAYRVLRDRRVQRAGLLLERGAALSLKNTYGRTPL